MASVHPWFIDYIMKTNRLFLHEQKATRADSGGHKFVIVRTTMLGECYLSGGGMDTVIP